MEQNKIYPLLTTNTVVDENNTEKNKARDSVYNLIIEKIQYEVGHRFSRKKAEAIWNRAYEDGHSFGFYEIRCRLSDLIDLAITLLGGDK